MSHLQRVSAVWDCPIHLLQICNHIRRRESWGTKKKVWQPPKETKRKLIKFEGFDGATSKWVYMTIKVIKPWFLSSYIFKNVLTKLLSLISVLLWIYFRLIHEQKLIFICLSLLGFLFGLKFIINLEKDAHIKNYWR